MRCRHCGEKNLLPIAQPAPPGPDPEQTFNRTLRSVIAWLLDGKSAGTFQRVNFLNHLLRSESDIAKLKQRDLANTLGVSEAAVSKGLTKHKGALDQLRESSGVKSANP